MIRTLLTGAVLAVFFVLSAQAAEKPNIVFLLADDMNRDTWGVYGSKDCKTPHIDQLAKEGMTFTRAYCSVAMCAPFRQELYSGRSPWSTGTLANHSTSMGGTKSIPHYLNAKGYRVALTGKSHVGPQEAYPFEMIRGNTNGEFIKAAETFFDDCGKEKTPFCLYIASHDGHAPFTTGDSSQYDKDKLTVPPYWLDTPTLRENLVKYYAEITHFDELVGRVRSLLKEKGLSKNTLLAVCSEQGVQFPFAKWTCYDNGLRTGLVMSWPGVIPAGSQAEELISIADITPTFVEAAGGSLQEGEVDGKSFLKMLKGEKQVLHEYVYGAFSNCNIIDNRDRIFPIRSIRSKDFTLLYNPNFTNTTSNVALTKKTGVAMSFHALEGSSAEADALIHKMHHRPEYELYSLRNDPYELKNEINNPEYKEVVDMLKKQLHLQLAKLGDCDPIATEKSLVKNKTSKSNKGKSRKSGKKGNK